MANTNAPFGFRPIKGLASGTLQVGYYGVASSASRIGKGDLVTLTTAGQIKRETSATAVGPWIGVSLVDSGTISAAIVAHPVCDDPSQLYEVQGSTAALALTDLNTIVKVKWIPHLTLTLEYPKMFLLRLRLRPLTVCGWFDL
jgi:hypothetical protein